MALTTVNRGNVIATVVMQIALTPAQTAANTTLEQTFTVPGLQAGDQVSGLTYLGALTVAVDFVNFRVSAANTLAITFANGTGGALTFPSGNFYLEINRLESLPAPSNAA
jgi:hypothetical protein